MLPISMVPYLHQSNGDAKRKLRVWRAQKCNRFIGAKNLQAVVGMQSTRLHAAPNTADNENLGKFGATYLRICTNAMIISKRSYGYGEPENVMALSVIGD